MDYIACLGILDNQVTGREDQGDQGGREEHLNDGYVPVIATKDSRKGISVIDSETL